MISRIVLGGLTAKQWARINGYSGEPRDHMNAEQLEHLSYLESTNITLIDMGMEYEQRKRRTHPPVATLARQASGGAQCLSQQEYHNHKNATKMPTEHSLLSKACLTTE